MRRRYVLVERSKRSGEVYYGVEECEVKPESHRVLLPDELLPHGVLGDSEAKDA